MPLTFSAGELIRVAIGIEQRGITFYDIMARSSDSAPARNAFEYLADMEREHIQIFQDMLDESRTYPPAAGDAEYAGYLQALIDNAVFTDDAITSEIATSANNDIQAVELGIDAEKDSLLFYYQMRDLMPAPALPMINRIIAEEKSHLEQLSELKKQLAAPP